MTEEEQEEVGTAVAAKTKLRLAQQSAMLCSSTVAKIPINLKLQLKSQLSKQSHPVPLSSYQAVNEQVTHWTTSYIADVLFIEMCERGPIVYDPGILSNKANGGEVNYYYLQAAKYAGRISAGNFDGPNAKHKPIFEIRYKDFTPRLQAEFQCKSKRNS
jgi:hypothetical protein